ncbi:MAG TPA: hypothetical protein PKA60_02135 [Candidatus Paceibacterota bacterium]|nr:hypothetical protein [Candidatus Paceibacterota bacterium]
MATKQQIPKLAGTIVEHQEAFENFSVEDAQWVIRNTKVAISLWVEAVENRVKPVTGGHDFDLVFWNNFYQKYFTCFTNFSTLQIPTKPKDGKWRLLVILGGLTNNQVYDACTRQFTCRRSVGDLNHVVLTNERDPMNGSYAIWVRDSVEADKVHQNKSADMIKEEGLKTETLTERMIHELVYFSETGKHLDVNKVTLCSGSRFSDGSVPGAGWYDGDFQVCWYYSFLRGRRWCSREVVSI